MIAFVADAGDPALEHRRSPFGPLPGVRPDLKQKSFFIFSKVRLRRSFGNAQQGALTLWASPVQIACLAGYIAEHMLPALLSVQSLNARAVAVRVALVVFGAADPR